MAGNIRGRLDCKSAAGGANTTIQTARNTQAMFATIWNFLDAMATAGRITRIASNYGNAASATNLAPPTNTRGVGYWDEAVNFGYDAFGVWRFDNALHPWYLFLELIPSQNNTLPSSSKIDGGTTLNSAAIGISAAWGLDAGAAVASPWAGGTANAGADARANGTPARWVDPGGGLWVLPRSNMLYGDNVTARSNSCHLVNNSLTSAATSLCYNIWADDDSFLVAFDQNDANAWQVNGIVRMTPRAGLTYPRPYLMANLATGATYWPWSPAFSNVIGSITATTPDLGGVIMPTGHTGSQCRGFGIDRLASIQGSVGQQPANVSGSLLYDEFSIKVAASETATTNAFGTLGEIDSAILREAYNVVSATTNGDPGAGQATRIFLGSTTTAAYKASLKWNGTTAPRTYAGATDAIKRVGVQGANTATVL